MCSDKFVPIAYVLAYVSYYDVIIENYIIDDFISTRSAVHSCSHHRNANITSTSLFNPVCLQFS